MQILTSTQLFRMSIHAKLVCAHASASHSTWPVMICPSVCFDVFQPVGSSVIKTPHSSHTVVLISKCCFCLLRVTQSVAQLHTGRHTAAALTSSWTATHTTALYEDFPEVSKLLFKPVFFCTILDDLKIVIIKEARRKSTLEELKLIMVSLLLEI